MGTLTNLFVLLELLTLAACAARSEGATGAAEPSVTETHAGIVKVETGKAIVRCVPAEDGTLTECIVVKGVPGYENAAVLTAVREMRVEPSAGAKFSRAPVVLSVTVDGRGAQ